MIKKVLYIIGLLFLCSCNNENTGDCFQTAGEIIQKEIEVPVFDKILVHKRVALVLKEGPVQKVVVETGKNLLPDIQIEVINNEIVLENHNVCNFVRDYGITKVYITAPNITTIRNASELNIISEGILTYPSLYLRSSGEKNKFLAVGDWHLQIENQKVKIWSNGIANFYISGSTDELDLSFSDGDTRFEGGQLYAKNVTVRQVSSNDMIIRPIQSLSGSIHSTGDVISLQTPPVIDVDVQSSGKLIFR